MIGAIPLCARICSQRQRYLSTVCIGYSRTPIGKLGGQLSGLAAPTLGAAAISAAITESGIDKNRIEECYMGNVVSSGIGQAPARQSAIGAGLSPEVVCTTVNKVCASGMKAVMLSSLSINSGYRDVVIAGGMESMSNIPHYLLGSREGFKLGDRALKDGLILDGLFDVYAKVHMGNIAEMCAAKYGITRGDQDEYAAMSYSRAAQAWDSGAMAAQVHMPMELLNNSSVKPIKGQGLVKESSSLRDEEIAGFDREKMLTMRSAFIKEGTVTAANASKLSDGAAALVLSSSDMAAELGLKPLFRIVGFADAERTPSEFPIAPTDAVSNALKRCKMKLSDIHYHEINEAFSAVALANMRLLGLSVDRVNVHGGAVALGHPLGASGARIIGTLYHVLKEKDATLGCASICNGGGGASAVIIERLN